MMAYWAFLKKELLESMRTYKTFVLMMIFIIFGILNPVMAKVMPELLEALLPEGMTITIEEPKALDSWMQFFKNGAQTGMIILTVVFSGLMAGELSKGTLINMLTKGLKRRTVILAKFTGALLQWTVAYGASFLITYGYTSYFFPPEQLPHLALAIMAMWVFGLILLALVIFGGLLFKNIYGALLTTGSAVLVMTLLSLFPKVKPYNPMTLVSDNVALLMGEAMARDMFSAMGVTILLTLGLLVLSMVDLIKITE